MSVWKHLSFALLLLNMSALKTPRPHSADNGGTFISINTVNGRCKIFIYFFLRKISHIYLPGSSQMRVSPCTQICLYGFCVCDSGCVSTLFSLCLWSPWRWFARVLWDSRSVLSEENGIFAAGHHSSGTIRGYEGKRTEAAAHAETYTHIWTHTDYRTHIHTSASFPQTHLLTTQHHCQCGSDFFVNKTTSWFRVLLAGKAINGNKSWSPVEREDGLCKTQDSKQPELAGLMKSSIVPSLRIIKHLLGPNKSLVLTIPLSIHCSRSVCPSIHLLNHIGRFAPEGPLDHMFSSCSCFHRGWVKYSGLSLSLSRNFQLKLLSQHKRRPSSLRRQTFIGHHKQRQ